MDILNKIVPNAEIEISLSNQYISKLNFFENEVGKWCRKSINYTDANKLVLNITDLYHIAEAFKEWEPKHLSKDDLMFDFLNN